MDRRRVLQGAGLGAAALAVGGRGWASSGLPESATPVAKTAAGMVSGYMTRKVISFKGIPYGADTRTTRFQAPKPVAPWTGVKVCTEWGARAPQQSPDRGRPDPAAVGFQAMEGVKMHYHLPPDEGPQSEDCLHVNVWTPALRDGKLDGKGRAVLFYIHGGAYNNGTVNAALYDGARLVERGDVVVVTVNHRLNAFGYMYLAGIAGAGGEVPGVGQCGAA